VHHLHIWSLGAGEVALTAHHVRPQDCDHDGFIADPANALDARFGINHATLRIERDEGWAQADHGAAKETGARHRHCRQAPRPVPL
jgi:cobalt-zinc-cadmium efflux system protein